ncbi:MAG TPA: methylated-DNA--[protein]-cysteine S-methyltransferase [Candidatus Obscuribacterales bacterium]
MTATLLKAEHYPMLEQAVAWLEANYQTQPSLDQIADQAGFSPMHFQRLFKEGVGISPKRFLQLTTLRHAKGLLAQEHSVLDTSLAVGLSGPGRLHDLCVECEAVTPGDVRRRGEGLVMDWGIHETPFGPALIALTDKGICELAFLPDKRHKGKTPAQGLAAKWPGAVLIENPARTAAVLERVFSAEPGPLTLYLRGTNFQIQVWKALLGIPAGQVVSYQAISRWLGQPAAMRAVGSAVGQNPISYLIPCHRVLRSDGGIGGYAGGTVRKRILLACEMAG